MIEGSHPTLSVIIPAYNEEASISTTVERVMATRSSLGSTGVELELIVVDDGSSDRTAEIASSCPGVRLIRHSTNRGYGAALKTGFGAACGDLLAFLDADGTYPPEHFPDLCREVLREAELAVGSRRSGALSKMPLLRRVGNCLWSSLVSLLSSERVMDPASGMRVLRREVLERLYPLPDGLNFTPVMSTRAIHEGVRVVEIPIPYHERIGRSKLSVLRDGTRFLQTIVWTALSYNPVRLLGGVGAGFVGVGCLIAAILIGMRISGVTTLGPAGVSGAFAAAMLCIVGVDLFALGATFNHLVSLFHKRPVRQGILGKPIFPVPLERQFWWLGALAIGFGLSFAAASLSLSIRGWPIERLWLYLLAGTVLILIGTQLEVFWVIVRVLEELSQREARIKADMECGPAGDDLPRS